MGALTLCAVVSAWTIANIRPQWNFLSTSASPLAENNLDERLQRAASATLGDQRGTIIVMDPHTGRIRAVVNREMAFGETFRPGSTIKPFTALAALRSGVIDEESRTLCHEKYSHVDFQTTCSHPRELSPLNPTEAIAYSCNYFFGTLGEHLSEVAFNSTLNEFGFGKKTGMASAHEEAGRIKRDEWQSQTAIGEGDYLRATPLQVLNAYVALVNGGHLMVPDLSTARAFTSRVQNSVSVDERQRSVILKGMRGAVRYGTAEAAKLYTLPAFAFGKTGTSTQIDGFRTQGWFVGFVTSQNDNSGGEDVQYAPANVGLAVLVFLERAHGSEAATLARPIFEEYTRASEQGRQQQHETSPTGAASLHANQSPGGQENGLPKLIRVHLVRENVTREMPPEDYVRGVVAAEGSMETEPEALKALAIASRTYALKNYGRHERDGYDFCSTTHCERYISSSNASANPLVVDAVDSTRGEILRDAGGNVVESYFSASCGGETANKASLWGGNAPIYLRGVHDEYCASEPHHAWTDIISEKQLISALHTDPRTDVGNHLSNLQVARIDATGRAESITIEGDRRLSINGWEFKIILGRALGWNYLKSSRFEIARSGPNFVFRGSGFGHGLGLCQAGAHVMAARGANYRQILAKYFPTTRLTNEDDEKPASADLLWNYPAQFLEDRSTSQAFPGAQSSRTIRSLKNENLRISYPDSVPQREIESLISLFQASRSSLLGRISASGLSVRLPFLEVFVNATTGDFVGRTRQPPWAAASTNGARIELQPIETLKKRRILETTVRHELVHAVVGVLSHGRAPRWLAEGMALYVAGEGPLVVRNKSKKNLTTDEIDKQLARPGSESSAATMRAAYAAAYSEVKRLIDREGERSVWRRLEQ
jgi:stage II sporulation protein D